MAGESGIGIGPVACSIVAIFLLCIVLAEKTRMLDALYPVKKHPASLAFNSLCFVEIVGLCAFLTGLYQVDNQEDCRATGLVMHYFFLASVMWIGLITVDLSLRSKLATLPPLESTPESRAAQVTTNAVIVGCFSWGVPAICILSQTVPTGNCWDGSKYGGSDFCWITSDHAVRFTFYLPAAVAVLIGTIAWVRWFLMLSVAADDYTCTPQMIQRVTNDLHGAVASLCTGAVAYFSIASISTNDATSTQSAQLIYCVAILCHTVALVYYFVVLPALEPTAWIVATKQPMSEGSMGSASHHTLSSRGARDRPMALPPSGGHLRQGSDDLSEPAAARRALAMAVTFSMNELMLFSKKLREAAPRGNVTYAQFLATWESCFPDKLENGKAYVDHIFQVFDRDGDGTIDHQELTLMLGASSFSNLEDKVNALFTLYDLDGDGTLSTDEIFQMTKRILNIDATSHTTDWLRVRDIAEMMHLEIDANGDGLISREEFLAAATTPGGVLHDVLTGPMVN